MQQQSLQQHGLQARKPAGAQAGPPHRKKATACGVPKVVTVLCNTRSPGSSTMHCGARAALAGSWKPSSSAAQHAHERGMAGA